MRRKLLLLELGLVAVATLAGVRARHLWIEAHRRPSVVQTAPAGQPTAPASSAAQYSDSFEAEDYSHVSQELVFNPERNSSIVRDTVPPRTPPEVPFAYGILDFGEGPIAIMSAKVGARPQQVRAGEMIGEYRLLAAGSGSVTLEWEGRQMTREIGEPKGRSGLNLEPRPELLAWAVDLDAATGPNGPGHETASGRACRAGDTSPAGTTSAGYRKVVLNTAAGQICRWVPAR